MKTFLINLLLTIALSLVSVIAFELLPIGKMNVERIAYFSMNPWKRSAYKDDFIITLQPNQTIREYVKYGEAIDYDITFETDRFGFRSTGWPNDNRQVISVVGDSFTMGTGGLNWVEELSKGHPSLRGYFFYNNGIGATGVEHWKALIDYLNEEMEIDKFVIVMIERDLRRLKWHSVENEDGQINLCVRNKCTPMDITTNMNLESLREKRKRSIKNFFKSNFHNTYHYVYVQIKGYFLRYLGGDQDRFDKLIDFLKSRVRLKFLLIKIASKEGVLREGNKFELRENPGNVIYVENKCFSGLADFHVNDPHPNNAGYNRLAACISGIIARHIKMFRQ